MDAFDSGFCVRQPSWHGRETLLDYHPQTWAEARPLAGLDWEYQEGPVYVDNPDGRQRLKGWKAITRSDTHDVLHVAQDSFGLITNQDLGDILHYLTESEHLTFETAGSVRGGRDVWALVRVAEDQQIGRDPSLTRPYLGVVNHLGNGAARAFPTSIRIVCWNTMSAADAQADRDNTVARFLHRQNWRDHLETAREAIQGAKRAFEDWKVIAEELQLIPITDSQAEAFVQTFIPYPPEQGFITDRVRNNIETARIELRTVLHESVTTEGIRGSAYWLVQSAGEYLDHLRPYRKYDSYVSRTVLNTSKGKGLAAQYAREIAGVK